MNRIRELRHNKGLLQKEIEKEINIGRGTLSNYENEKRSLTPALIGKLCDIFGVTADYLLCRSDNPAPQISPEDLALLQAYHTAPDHIQAAARSMLQVGEQKEAPAVPEARAAG